MSNANLARRGMLVVVGAVVGILAGIYAATQIWVNVDASEIVVVQSPISGKLSVYTEPGWKLQNFGTVTRYPRRAQFAFLARKDGDGGRVSDESISTRFNDGGHGNISGSINWAMPLSPDKVIALHKDFRGFEAIEQQLLRRAVQKVVFNVGPTMSSTESSAERRPQIPTYIDDQLENGPYLTKTVQKLVKDQITGQDKMQNVVEIAVDDTGKPVREAISPLTEYGLQLQPVSIENIKYDEVVENQIKQRQEATTQVQISIANARKAEQQAITTEQEGRAAAAKAKWEQETVNAKQIAEAEKNKQIAQLQAEQAAEYKRRLILEGEGEAKKRELILSADGALTQKLEAYVKVNAAYADAIKSAQPGAWTPSVVMGDGAKTGSSADSLVNLLMSKTAKELGADLQIKK